MTLTEKIANDMKEAMKSGDKTKLGTLRMVRAALLELQKSGAEVTPDLELRAVQKQAASRKDAMQQFVAAGRNDRRRTAGTNVVPEAWWESRGLCVPAWVGHAGSFTAHSLTAEAAATSDGAASGATSRTRGAVATSSRHDGAGHHRAEDSGERSSVGWEYRLHLSAVV